MQTVKAKQYGVATFQTDYDDEVEFAARRWLVDRGRDAAAGNNAVLHNWPVSFTP